MFGRLFGGSVLFFALRRLPIKRDGKRNSAQGLVEFALVLPLFLVLLFAMVEFGRAWMTKNILTGAAREAVRLAAVQTDFATSQSSAVTRATEVLNSASISVPPANVVVESFDSPEPIVKVTITYPFPLIVGGIFGIGNAVGASGGTITLESTATMRRERY